MLLSYCTFCRCCALNIANWYSFWFRTSSGSGSGSFSLKGFSNSSTKLFFCFFSPCPWPSQHRTIISVDKVNGKVNTGNRALKRKHFYFNEIFFTTVCLTKYQTVIILNNSHHHVWGSVWLLTLHYCPVVYL